MAILNESKAVRTLRKTPHILQVALSELSEEQAATRRDGPHGWSVVYIVCHLRDFEHIHLERVRDALAFDVPTFRAVNNDDLIRDGDYGRQTVRAAFAEYVAARERLLTLLAALTPDEWQRRGVHPVYGEGTILDVAINAGLHDVDHIEQILKCDTN